MGFLFKNNKEKQSPSLDELKKLTIGVEPQKSNYTLEKNKPQEQTQPTLSKEVKEDINSFKEEQKIFTQITSIKEIEIDKDYAVPKELTPPKEEGKEEGYTILKKQTSQTSAFEKLLNKENMELNEDKKNETLSSKNYSSPQITQEHTETTMNQDNGTIETTNVVKTKIENKPQVNNDEKETNTIQGQQSRTDEAKDVFFNWMKQPEIEEPKEVDFGENENKEYKESSFSKNKKNFDEKKELDKATKLRTPIDEIFELLEKYGKIDVGEVANFIKIPESMVEQITKPFEEIGVIEVNYPTSLTKKPIIILKNPVVSKITQIPQGETLDSYTIEVDFVPAKISIILSNEEARPVYTIQMPSIGKYTRKFLSFIKEEVAETMPIDLEEITDPKKSKKLKDRFFTELSTHLKKYFPQSPIEMLQMLSGVLLHEMYGLGDIEILMGDDMLEEVGINSAKTPITVYHRVHGWLKTNLMPGGEEEINNFSSQIGRKVGREITILSPILDAHLLSGDRVNATLFPISSEGNTITIRRFARKPWTIIDFIGKAHTMSSEMAAMLWLAMQYEMNIIIAGGTASGKTSALNSMLALVPTYHRIISIEDVREIILPSYLDWNWIPLVTRSPNPEGLGEVTMLDLMVTSLRMRPDRIIVGEMRRKKEAEVLMEAIETGHSIYSTIHANSGYQVLRRLAEPPMSIPLMQIELIDLIVVQYRDRKTNKRRTYEIAEVEQTSSGQGLQINTVFKWSPRTDAWEKLNKPNKLITLLNMHTGMTEEDINKEIADRQIILDWMKRQNITELDMIGFLMKIFYGSPAKLKKMAQDNVQAEKILELMKPEEKPKEENKVN
jgi:archaeal flagellar protein FlaI